MDKAKTLEVPDLTTIADAVLEKPAEPRRPAPTPAGWNGVERRKAPRPAKSDLPDIVIHGII